MEVKFIAAFGVVHGLPVVFLSDGKSDTHRCKMVLVNADAFETLTGADSDYWLAAHDEIQDDLGCEAYKMCVGFVGPGGFEDMSVRQLKETAGVFE